MLAEMSVLFLILAAVIGIFIGLLLSSLFSNKDNQKKKKPEADVIKEGFGEVSRLWYSPAGRTILTEMDGGFYKKFDDMTQEQKSKVMKLINLWQGWAVEKTPEPTPTTPVEPVNDVIAVSGSAVAENVLPFTQPAEEEDVVSVLQQSLEEDEEPEIDITPTSPTGQLSITEQISLILQELLEGSELKEKGVKLIENEDNGVDVWVGMEKYPGVEAVPYPQVRQLIHEAVMRWENETDMRQRLGV
jgi:hypothetical protein